MIANDFHSVAQKIAEFLSSNDLDRNKITNLQPMADGDNSFLYVQWGRQTRVIDIPAEYMDKAVAIIEGRSTADSFMDAPRQRESTRIPHEAVFVAQL